jgi:CBS-domain-containing membrane protein
MNGSMSLYHLVEMFTRGIHRVPVQDEKSALWAVATQSTVVRYLAKNLKEIGRALDKPIDYLGLGKRQAISVTWTARTLDGYILLDKHKVEAIAVTDEAGVLVGALSASDLRGLGAGLFAAFQQPVREFIKGQPPPETCAPDASLKDLVAQLAATRSHRAWLVTRDRRPFGVVSNTDVMKALLLCLNVSPRRRRTRSVDFSKLRSSKVLGSTT